MLVSFELTRDDYAALTFHKAPSRALTRRRLLVLGALSSLSLALMALLTFLTGDLAWIDDAPLFRPLLWATGGVLGAFVLLAALLGIVRTWVRRLPREDGAILGHHELELAEDGLHVEGRAGRSFVKWGAIVEVRESGEHVFLFLDRMLAYIVPKRAFASPADCASFVEYAKARAGQGLTS